MFDFSYAYWYYFRIEEVYFCQGGHFSGKPGKPGKSLESQNASGKPGKPGIFRKM